MIATYFSWLRRRIPFVFTLKSIGVMYVFHHGTCMNLYGTYPASSSDGFPPTAIICFWCPPSHSERAVPLSSFLYLHKISSLLQVMNNFSIQVYSSCQNLTINTHSNIIDIIDYRFSIKPSLFNIDLWFLGNYALISDSRLVK